MFKNKPNMNKAKIMSLIRCIPRIGVCLDYYIQLIYPATIKMFN